MRGLFFLTVCGCFVLLLHDRGIADVVFSTDVSSWQTTNPDFDEFAFDSGNVGLSDEIATPPGGNENIGSILTFQAAATGFDYGFSIQTLETGSDFTFDDNEGGSIFDDVLSVGDINNFEDDDFRVDFFGANVFGFGFELRDNDSVTGESFSVFGASGLLGTLAIIPGSSGSVFVGVNADEAITHVIFDEDSGGDDIAVGAIFASTSIASVPEPGSAALVAFSLLFFVSQRRKC